MKTTGSVSSDHGGDPNPYVGPRPFRPGEKLYGREDEITDLQYLWDAERIVLLHSPSGAGKSSLLQAGFLPRIQRDFDVWGPTRVNQEPPGGDPSVNRYALSAMQGFEEAVPERLRRPPAQLATQSLLEYYEKRPRRRSAPKRIALLFDQFEEILTVDPLAVAAKREFFDQLGELLHDPQVWALFVLREDYLAPLDPYVRQVPTHLRNRFRIDMLGLEGARQAIVNPALEGGREFPAADQLLRDLAALQVQQADGSFREQIGHYVEPVQLQVVCRRLWDAMPAGGLSIDCADLKRFGDVTEALAGYYADSVTRVAGGDEASERAVREWFGDALIAAAGIRGQVLKGPEESEGLGNEIIAELLDTHLVRAEQRAGATWYELAHDRLIEPVRQNNAAWRDQHLSAAQQRAALWQRQGRPPGLLIRDQELAAGERWAARKPAIVTAVERRFLEQSRKVQDAVERERRQALWIRRLAIAASVVSVLALAALGLATAQTLRANREAAKAVAVSDFLVGMFEEVDPEAARGEEVTARQVLDEGDQKIGDLDDQPEVQATLRHTMGKVYFKLGLYKQARPHLESVLETRQRRFGRQHPETLSSIAQVGDLLIAQGEYPAAEKHLREALEGRRRALGDDHPDTLASINDMGVLHYSWEKYPEAEPFFFEALEGRRRLLGADHSDTLESINNMGALLIAEGKLEAAERYFLEDLEAARRVLGDDHPDTLTSINNMGALLQFQEKYPEAERYFHEALEGRRRVYPDDHPDKLESIANMGFLLQSQGRFPEAEPFFLEAFEGVRRVHGDDHPGTLTSIRDLVDLYASWGKPAGAAEWRNRLPAESSGGSP